MRVNRLALRRGSLICLFCWMLGSANGQSIRQSEMNAIQRQAKFMVEEFSKLLVNLSNENNSVVDIEKIIYNNIYGDRIFWNARVNIEDDLDPKFSNYSFPQDKSVEDYLKDFDIYYGKKTTGTIVFDSLRVSDVQRSVEGYWFVKVLYRSRFLNRHKDFPIPYPTRFRVAEIRAERKDIGWNTYIMSIRYYDPNRDRDPYKEFDFLPEVIEENFQKLRRDSYVWIARGEYGRSLNLLERAYALKPTQEVEASIRALKEQISGIETRNQYFSVSAYTEYLEANPQDPDPYVGRGTKYLEASDLQNALTDFKLALGLKPYYIRALTLSGDTYLKLGLLDSAIQSYKAILEITPDDAPLSLKVASLYYSDGRYSKAKEVLSEAIEIAPEIPQLYALRVKAKFANRLYSAAVEDIQVLSFLQPDSAKYTQWLGNIYQIMGKQSQSDSAFSVIQGKQPSYSTQATLESRELIDRADKLFKEGQYLECAHLLNDRILLTGIQAVDLLLRGKASLEAGFTTFALEDFTLLMETQESAEVYYLRALAAQKLGNIEGAKSDLSEAILRDSYLCDAFLLLAKIYDGEDDYPKAVSYYDRALNCRPNQPQYHLDLAELHFRNDEFAKSESSARDALFFDPKRAEAYLIIGRSQIQQDKYRDAELQYLKFLKYGKEDADVYLEMAEFYEKYFGWEKRANKFRRKAEEL